MKSIFLLSVFCVATSFAKLHVTVLYESLCPDSRYFVRNQLAPNYDALQDYITIDLVPFGKARSLNGGNLFECQHGPAECKGNMIQSCTLKRIEDEYLRVAYVICQMSPQTDPTGEYCSKLVGVPFEDVQNCVNSQEGIQLQLEAEEITNTYDHSFIPTMVFNHQFNKTLQRESFSDFRGTVCKLTGCGQI